MYIYKYRLCIRFRQRSFHVPRQVVSSFPVVKCPIVGIDFIYFLKRAVWNDHLILWMILENYVWTKMVIFISLKHIISLHAVVIPKLTISILQSILLHVTDRCSTNYILWYPFIIYICLKIIILHVIEKYFCKKFNFFYKL